MRALHKVAPRQLAAHAVVAITVATATAAGVALAGSNNSATVARTSASTGHDPIAVAARTALDQLVARGAINQSQADAIEQDVIAGSIDPRALVGDGLVSEQQMQAVAAALDQVKRSAGQ